MYCNINEAFETSFNTTDNTDKYTHEQPNISDHVTPHTNVDVSPKSSIPMQPYMRYHDHKKTVDGFIKYMSEGNPRQESLYKRICGCNKCKNILKLEYNNDHQFVFEIMLIILLLFFIYELFDN
jgi:hypothetical protein